VGFENKDLHVSVADVLLPSRAAFRPQCSPVRARANMEYLLLPWEAMPIDDLRFER
jgi:hypothetical protein